MTFPNQLEKDAAIVAAQKVVSDAVGQAKVNAQAALVATQQAQVVG